MSTDIPYFYKRQHPTMKMICIRSEFYSNLMLIQRFHYRIQRCNTAKGEKFDSSPNWKMSAIFIFMMLYTGKILLTTDFFIQFIEKFLMPGLFRFVVNFRFEIHSISISFRTIFFSKLICNFRSKLNLDFRNWQKKKGSKHSIKIV